MTTIRRGGAYSLSWWGCAPGVVSAGRFLFVFVIFAGLCPGVLTPVWAESLVAISARADTTCVNFKPIGACVRKGGGIPGVKVRYWQPVLMVETVKKSGDTVIDEYRSVMSGLLPSAARMSMGVADTNAGAGSTEDGGGMQINEAHVFGYLLSDALSAMIEAPCEGAPESTGLVSYLSEQDAREWREGWMEKRQPMSLLTAKAGTPCEGRRVSLPEMCLGLWGPLYPRTGMLTHYSPVVASGVAAYRAVDIASVSGGLFHQRVGMLGFVPNMFRDKIQLVYPQRSGCLAIGEDPRMWADGKGSADGRYVWLYWRYKECCLF